MHCRPVFQPPTEQIVESQLTDFIAYCATKTGRQFADYKNFEEFCRDEYRCFWRLFLAWSALPVAGDLDEVCRGDDCETAEFFPAVQLNYAEAVLAQEQASILACHKDRPTERLTRPDIIERVNRVASLLQHSGVAPGDRVVAIARNNVEVVIVALACAAIGAVFASCATDMGVASILVRFAPLMPMVLCANLQTLPWDTDCLAQRISTVLAELPTVRILIALDDGVCSSPVPLHRLDDGEPTTCVWPKFAFNHPLFILFSSGTTGKPKCIIHGAGGTLLEHLKEHRLHGDLRPGDRLYFQTSCGWMMWNWQLSALAAGAELVLYDGPLDNPETLWRLVAEQQVTVFGTNPAYLQFCETAELSPRAIGDFAHLRSILSTGSILYPHQFDWIIREVKSVPVQSISGGSDIIGCFVLGNPNLPVYRGEAQCRSLGLDVRAIPDTRIGDLVCARPFPSRPLGLLNDDGSRFHATYFAANPGVWTHGDLIEFTRTGGAVLHGRSDGVLNIRGIRIGPAEIYHLLLDIPAIIEAMAVEQQAEHDPGGTRLILLVVVRHSLDAALAATIRQHLLMHGTSAMVPAHILQVSELPITHNGKRSESAARDAINGRPIRNRDALRNPECLDQITQQRFIKNVASPQQDTLLESWLQQMCQNAYGIPSIEWTDNLLKFGDSLAFLNIHLQIGLVIGRPLPWLTTTPTIARLAAAIRHEHVSEIGEQVVVRPARFDDRETIYRLLEAGFPRIRNPALWQRLFDYPWSRRPPTDGFVLVADQTIVGFLGTFYAARVIRDKRDVVCNLTSWYIDPAYRGWGAAMLSAVLEHDDFTYTALTPAPLPKALFKAMGFTDITDRSLILLPFQHAHTLRNRPQISFLPLEIRQHLTDSERQLFDDHVDTACLHVLVRDSDQHAYLLVKRRHYKLTPWSPWLAASKVLYCSAPDFVAERLEWIKLAIMRYQRTLAVVVSARWFTVPPRGVNITSHMLMRSSVFAPGDLDALYSEVCLLPV
jgi:acetoacetyl-CoA synthetase